MTQPQDDAEAGLNLGPRRYRGFATGAAILLGYVEAGGVAPEGDFLSFEQAVIGDDMLVYRAHVYVPGAVTINEHGVEQSDNRRGGVLDGDARTLRANGWEVRHGAWYYDLESYPDPYK